MVRKFASLLSADASDYGKIIKDLEDRGFYGIHFDIMDGHFVRNFAFNASIIASLRKLTGMVFEAHLEIENPEQYLDMFIDAGSDMITIHPQTTRNPEGIFRYLRTKKVISSAAVDPDIKVESIRDFLPLLDNITIMSVYPGFGRQDFIKGSLERIRYFRQAIGEGKYKISISVDGSINGETEKTAINCGADTLVYGSSIFRR